MNTTKPPHNLEPQIGVGDEVYINRPQHATFSSGSAEEFSLREYRNFMPRKRGLYKETEVLSIHSSLMNMANKTEWQSTKRLQTKYQ